MTPKAPPPSEDDEKTVQLSRRRSSADEHGRIPPAASDRTVLISNESAESIDSNRTHYVSPPDREAVPPKHDTGCSDGGIPKDQTAGRRLSWPARDRQPIRRVETDVQGGGATKGDDEATRLWTPGRANQAAARDVSATPKSPDVGSGAEGAIADDPVVGWLVIVQGPGKGRSLEIGAGANSIGRDRTQKLCFDFGDREIHREKHALLVYDPRSRRYFLQSGDARNLTYLGEELVLAPIELKGGETIIIGQTHIRFVAFCGSDFSW